MECLAKLNYKIDPVDKSVYDKVIRNWDMVAKPIAGLGDFELLTAKIGAIQGTDQYRTDKKALLIFCSDNGITKEGVSQSPSEVTKMVVKNMLDNRSSVTVMANKADVDPFVIDVGVDADPVELNGCINRKIRRGTRNFAEEPAMTDGELIKAVECGVDLVRERAEEGYDIIALGEMGIGNTTTSSAICASLLDLPVGLVTGHGAGMDEEGYLKKKTVIDDAIQRYDLKSKDVSEILKTVGGYDIAALAGACIGGALYHIPIVLDGVITMTAALVAQKLALGCRDYLIASHKGKEPASEILLENLRLKAVIDANMALGEGTGAIMMFALLDQATEVYRKAASFGDISLKQYVRYDSAKEKEEDK